MPEPDELERPEGDAGSEAKDPPPGGEATPGDEGDARPEAGGAADKDEADRPTESNFLFGKSALGSDPGKEPEGEKADEEKPHEEKPHAEKAEGGVEPEDKPKDGDGRHRKPSAKGASASAVARLKARAGRDARKKPAGPRRRRLSDEERQALWHKAVMRKAHKFKKFTDVVIFLLLACVLGAHALTFVGEIAGRPGWEAKAGYELVLDLVLEGTYPRAPLILRERTEPRPGSMAVVVQTRKRDLVPREAATPLAYAYLAIPGGAALLVLLYLLDRKLWMGRLLPSLSLLYGFGSVGYLLATNVFMDDGPWYLLRRYNATASWYMLIVPLFLLGAISMLRFVVSQRWKRYEFAGLPVPGRDDPTAGGEPGAPPDDTPDDVELDEDKPRGDRPDDKPDDKPDEGERPREQDRGEGDDKPGEDEPVGDKADDAPADAPADASGEKPGDEGGKEPEG